MAESPGPMEKPKTVSCVTTFYNAERYLAQAIESVIAQTHGCWELLLVDDGSTDRSREIADRYARRHPDRIRVLEHKSRRNEGKSASRNLGVRSSQGAIIALLDADDIWLPNKLEAQMKIFFEQPEVDLVLGPVLYWYSWTNRPQDIVRDCALRPLIATDEVIDSPDALTRLLKIDARRDESAFPYPSSTAFRRAIFEKVGGFEDDFRQLYDDTIFFAKVLAIAKIIMVEAIHCRYRLHPDQTMSHSFELAGGKSDAFAFEEKQFLSRLRDFLDSMEIFDRSLRIALWEADVAASNGLIAKTLRALRMVKRRTWGVAPGHPPAFELARPPADSFFNGCVTRFASALQGKVGELGDDALVRRHGQRSASYTVLPAMAEEIDGLEKFNCILAMDALRFSDRPKVALNLLAGSLLPGGVLLLGVTLSAPHIPDRRDRWRFTEEELRGVLEEVPSLRVLDILRWRARSKLVRVQESAFVRCVKQEGLTDGGGH